MNEQPFDFNTPITSDITLIAKYDCPNGVTLTQLKTALDNGTAATTYPVNTQVDDYTNDSYDPWIVGHYGAQYGNSSTNGVYLYRKYLYPENQAWGTGSNYGESAINTWLNTTYLESCSDEIKGMVEQINVPLVSGTTPAKMFLMSASEVMALSTGYAGGVAWDGWKERTGLTEPSTNANTGRIMSHGELANGQGETWLLRTEMNGQSGNADIEGDGACRTINPNTPAGVAVACFIAKPAYDPSNPTLDGLQAAMQAGDYTAFPTGTEIPDTYDGQSNPLIVAQYLDSSNNSAYGGAEGAICVRKYVEPTDQTFGTSVNYMDSTVKTFLETTYYNNCSESLKSIIADINIPYYNGSSMASVTSKWFLMSGIEVGGTYNAGEGYFWEYWKEKTGWSTPSNNANTQRKMYDRSGVTKTTWLRSRFGTDPLAITGITTAGAISSNGVTGQYGVLPACFIPKNPAVTPEALTAQEYDNLDLTAQAYDNANLTAEEYDTNGKNLLS